MLFLIYWLVLSLPLQFIVTHAGASLSKQSEHIQSLEFFNGREPFNHVTTVHMFTSPEYTSVNPLRKPIEARPASSGLVITTPSTTAVAFETISARSLEQIAILSAASSNNGPFPNVKICVTADSDPERGYEHARTYEDAVDAAKDTVCGTAKVHGVYNSNDYLYTGTPITNLLPRADNNEGSASQNESIDMWVTWSRSSGIGITNIESISTYGESSRPTSTLSSVSSILIWHLTSATTYPPVSSPASGTEFTTIESDASVTTSPPVSSSMIATDYALSSKSATDSAAPESLASTTSTKTSPSITSLASTTFTSSIPSHTPMVLPSSDLSLTSKLSDTSNAPKSGTSASVTTSSHRGTIISTIGSISTNVLSPVPESEPMTQSLSSASTTPLSAISSTSISSLPQHSSILPESSSFSTSSNSLPQTPSPSDASVPNDPSQSPNTPSESPTSSILSQSGSPVLNSGTTRTSGSGRITNTNASPNTSFSIATITQTVLTTITDNGTASVASVVVSFVTTVFQQTTLSTIVGSSTVETISITGSLSISSLATSDVSNKGSTNTLKSSTVQLSVSISGSPTLAPLPVITASIQAPLVLCSDVPIPQWCAFPTTSTVNSMGQASESTVFSLPLCACPVCLMAPALCLIDQPTQTSSCPDGWLCTPSIRYPISTAFVSIPPGIEWTTKIEEWSEYSEFITDTKSTSTTPVKWTAALSTTTRKGDNDTLILFPIRVWQCVGPLCDPNEGLGWLEKIKCFLTIGCHNSFTGLLGFPPPPYPVPPPIGPPNLDYQLQATTITGTLGSNPEPTITQPSSATSCSTSYITSCVNTCFTVAVPTTLAVSCSQSCTTITSCSGNNVDTTTTVPCTQIVTFVSLVCTNITISGQSTSTCRTELTSTGTACQGSTATSFAACSVNTQPLDPNLKYILANWAAQIPINRSALTRISNIGSSESPIVPIATNSASGTPICTGCVSSDGGVKSDTATTTVQSTPTETFSNTDLAGTIASVLSDLGTVVPSQGPIAVSFSASLASAAALHSATQNAFWKPPNVAIEIGKASCPGAKYDLPEGSPENSEYLDFSTALRKIPSITYEFCAWIADNRRLGGQYYVYNDVEHGLRADDAGYNITWSVHFDHNFCSANGIEKYDCPGDAEKKGQWWICPKLFTGTSPLEIHQSSLVDFHDFCEDTFTKLLNGCRLDVSDPAAIYRTHGGWYFTPCLQWSVTMGPKSPTLYWPLQGDGTEDMSEVTKRIDNSHL